ncbi:MAG: YeeE/YedE thiosulfate transporter family protein [Actinomycetota bacterium]
MPAPFDLTSTFSQAGIYAVYVLVGAGFGAALEQSGFGRSTKLAAQFYFKDFAMFKVMFTAVITAMVLVFGASALGLLDYRAVYVNETYLWPIIIGGFTLGIGFLVGGLCPGTSLVGASTLKIDAMFFVGGATIGIFVFGETVPYFMDFWTQSYLGRLTVPDWLGLPTGVVVLLIVLMALFMFWGAERIDHKVNGEDPKDAPRARYAAAGGLVLLALVVLAIGQPGTDEYWDAIAGEEQARLDNREVQIHSGELLELMDNGRINLIMLDVRPERDYNQFHIRSARHVPPTRADVEAIVPDLEHVHPQTVIVAMSNDEDLATMAYKTLLANNVINTYILEDGVNGWIEIFGEDAEPRPTKYPEQPSFVFEAALGDRCVASDPDSHEFHLEFESKVELKVAAGPAGGGCG